MRRFASVRAVRSARNLQSWARCALHVGLHVHLVQMDEHAPECRFVPSGADGCQGLWYAGSVCHLVQMSDMACCEQVSAIWCRWLTMILECWFVPSGTDG